MERPVPPRPLSETELEGLFEKQRSLEEKMAEEGLYFTKWTIVGLAAGVLTTAVFRLRKFSAYIPMMAMGSLGSIADFAEAHLATNAMRDELRVITQVVRAPDGIAARREAVERGFLPKDAMDDGTERS
jgi:hypothetical protein